MVVEAIKKKIKLNIRERLRGFKKRSPDYKVACLYFVIALVLFMIAMWTGYQVVVAFEQGDIKVESWQIPSIVEALAFLSLLMLFAGFPAFAALLCFIAGMLFLLSDYHGRLKKLEKEAAEEKANDPD